MKFIVSSTYLQKNLQDVGGVISNSNTLPILDNFLFDLKDSKLTVSASDLETTVSIILEVDGQNDGRIAIPAKLLIDALKTFPEQPLTFLQEGNNTIEISSNDGKYALAYSDANDLNSTVIQMTSSYQLKSGDRLGDGVTAPCGVYTGVYTADYEYINNLGTLDEANGRSGVTPEYPNGTYYYVITENFPIIPRYFKGIPSNDFSI